MTIRLKSDGQGAVNQFHAYFNDVFWRAPSNDRARIAAEKLGYSLSAMKLFLSDKREPPLVLTRLLWHESTYAEREIDAYHHWALCNSEAARTAQAADIARLVERIAAQDAEIDDLKRRIIEGPGPRLIAANASAFSVR